ncbi:MAG: aminoacyl--tRNA ligase-related protein, partial [Candidatus Aenigmatarchaeota archaeon]
KIKKYKFKEDITEELVKRGWVKKFTTAGVWHFLPPMTALIRAIEYLIVERIAKPMEFQEIFLPRLISLETHMKKGQLAIPNDLFWVCPPISKNLEEFEDFIDYVEVTQTIPKELLMKKLDLPIGAISYAQCEGFYQIFEKEIVDLDKLPLKFFDRFGPTWRYEAGGLKGLERLNEFYRMEFVYIGSPEQVVDIRDEVKDRTLEIIDKIFDLEWRIDKVIPVYLEHAGKVEEEKEELVKTYDLTILLPFKTLSKAERELEIASFHVHKDFYAERFNFKDKAGRIVWTGCCGLGPTRFAYVFLLRWGFNFNEWPEEIKKAVKILYGKFPESFKLVSWP